MKTLPSPLCAIVDVDVAARVGRQPIDLARAFLGGGARFLQLRAKQLSGADFLETAAAMVELAHCHGATLLVNDRADIAVLAGADGVHIGQNDLPPSAIRRVVGSAAIVGLSTHSLEQLDLALDEPVDYVAIGPVFGTTTKDTGHEAVGLDLVRDAARRAAVRGRPLVAIGGITLDRAIEVVRAGAGSVAVISDLVRAGDPEARVRAYLQELSAP